MHAGMPARAIEAAAEARLWSVEARMSLRADKRRRRAFLGHLRFGIGIETTSVMPSATARRRRHSISDQRRGRSLSLIVLHLLMAAVV